MYGTEAGIVVEVSSLVMKRTPNSVSLYFTLSRSLLLLPSSNFYLSLCSCNWRSLLCLVHRVLLSLFLSSSLIIPCEARAKRNEHPLPPLVLPRSARPLVLITAPQSTPLSCQYRSEKVSQEQHSHLYARSSES